MRIDGQYLSAKIPGDAPQLPQGHLHSLSVRDRVRGEQAMQGGIAADEG